MTKGLGANKEEKELFKGELLYLREALPSLILMLFWLFLASFSHKEQYLLGMLGAHRFGHPVGLVFAVT